MLRNENDTLIDFAYAINTYTASQSLSRSINSNPRIFTLGLLLSANMKQAAI